MPERKQKHVQFPVYRLFRHVNFTLWQQNLDGDLRSGRAWRLVPDIPSPAGGARNLMRSEMRASFLQLGLPVGDDSDGLALCGLGRTDDQEVLSVAKRLPERIREGGRRRFEREKSLR